MRRELLLQVGDTLLRRATRRQKETGDDDAIIKEIQDELAWMMSHTPGATEIDRFAWRSELMFAATWAANGFPQISMGHRLAASLMATTVPPDYVATYQPPWTSFLVLVPDGLLSSVGSSGQPHFVHRIMCVAADSVVNVGMGGETSGWFQAATFADLVTAPSELAPNVALDSRALESVEAAMRSPGGYQGTASALDVLAARLLVNACLELETSKTTATYERRSNKPSRRESKTPKTTEYVLGRDVRVDCRAWVQKACRLGLIAPSVQSLVRGHYKNQPCGPGMTGRKWIHVEPYWRGPEDAPIVVRQHAMRGGGSGGPAS